jgi:hypothetical protein
MTEKWKLGDVIKHPETGDTGIVCESREIDGWCSYPIKLAVDISYPDRTVSGNQSNLMGWGYLKVGNVAGW